MLPGLLRRVNRCGLLVDPQNPHAIAEAIQWLLEWPPESEQIGKQGQRAVRKQYNWEGQADKLLGLYEKMMK